MASKMRVKPCPECNQESPVAKKSCECGYVFSKRATHGFQEMPVILTPERLRSLSRPVRKKQKLEDNDFVYANNTKTSKSKAGNLKDRQYTYGNSTRRIPSDIKKNNIEGHTILRSKNTAASASSKTGTQKYLTEKRKINIKSKQGNKSLEAIAKNIIKKSETSPAKSKTSGAPKSYPIRKRSSTSKYEPLLEMKLMRKNKKLRSDLREDEDKQISRKESKLEVDSSKLPEEKDHQSDQKIQKNTETIDGSHIEGVNANEKKCKKLQPDSKVLKTENELKLSSLEIEIDGEKDDNIKILSNNVNSPRTSSTPFVRLSPSVHELLLEHADQQIDVVTVKTEELMNWRKNLINTNLQANKALQVKKNFISDENSLLKIKIPKGIMKMMRQKAATAKKKAILTSTSKKNPAKNVAKRPIGRPRIHFKEDKPKRPLGRPRKHPEKKIKKMKVIRRSNIEGRRSDKLERFSKSAAVAELAEESISTLTDGSSESEIEVKVPKKRGRPKGTKDSKPRKQRQDRGQNRTGNFKTPIKGGRNARCFLSPPSLIASAKKERIKNEILEKVERDRLSKKLNGTQPMVIPPEKRELFSLILDEINRRIVSQSFSVR